ncbi:Annexin family and Annexin repeat-containing protein [Strongyloides ratti]|uniref:Annexin n=1 Tax=Strongyloides ratti TaxID=34506 RepID=A0A090LA14_STRRB|nr:Annexin family and Annexin repeat-containing protein [Strongyloides ratti]CEF64345.1 Annexin family and Annexin repeat-containing protein [Strongyloides ratti]
MCFNYNGYSPQWIGTYSFDGFSSGMNGMGNVGNQGINMGICNPTAPPMYQTPPSQYCNQAIPQSTLGTSQYVENSTVAVKYLFGTPSIKTNPNFNPMADANTLRNAMKGFGCDKNRILKVLCTCANWQRQQIYNSFLQMFGKDLIRELKSELSGDFEDLIVALMTRPAEYDAKELHRSMKGLGTRENILIEIMCSRSNSEIHQIKSVYQQLYGRNLENDICGDTSGYFKNFLLCLCAGNRNESGLVDQMSAQQTANTLYQAGEGRLGTDESTFLNILCSQNFAQLKFIFSEYHRLTGHTMGYAIEAEFSGDIKNGLLGLYEITMNRPAFFATQFENSMKGLGTKDKDLIRLTVTRSEIDMIDIRNEYFRMYGRTLQERIIGDTSGKYRQSLLTLVEGN